MKLQGIESVRPADQVVAPLLAQWSANRPYAGHPPGEVGGSALGNCSREIAYRLQGTPASNPMGESGLHSTGVGTLVHDAIQEEIQARPPAGVVGVEVEPHWSIDLGDGLTVAPAEDRGVDVELTWEDGTKETVEIKTGAGFGFKMKVTREGPARPHILQTAAAMQARGTDRGRIVFITPNELKGSDRVDTTGALDGRANRYHEWTFPWSAVKALIERELQRIEKIHRWVGEGLDVPRTIPGVTVKGAAVVGYNAAKRKGVIHEYGPGGELLGTKDTWHCGYCDWRDVCMTELQEAGK